MLLKFDFFVFISFAYLQATLLYHQGGRHRRQSSQDEAPVVFPILKEDPVNKCISYDRGTGYCRPAALCVFRFESAKDLEDSACTMDNGKIGICCPGKPPPTRFTGPNRPENPNAESSITSSDLDFAGQEGRSIVQRIEQLEVELQRRGLTAKKGSPEYFLEAQFEGNKRKVLELGRNGLIGLEATLKLIKTFQLSTSQGRDSLIHFSLANTVIADTCPRSRPCMATKYRTSDGHCNNLEHPEWGQTFQSYIRVLQPRYADGINDPRAAYDSGPLPSAREVSQRGLLSEAKQSQTVTVAFTMWAQFLAYDMSLTGVSHAGNSESILCCHEQFRNNPKLLHPACMPILVTDTDPLYRSYNRTCMHFVRSVSSPRSDCTFGPREQLNQVTSFIDGSGIYGSSENRTNELRSFEGGKLKWSVTGGEDMLPRNRSASCVSLMETPCFSAGDQRVNQNPVLILIHSVMLREHNRLAQILSARNPGWNDEILFKESRRLLVAELQHITYNEFLPRLIGNRVMSSYGLSLKLSGYSFVYKPDLNPGIINSFAAAASRFGHTLVQDDVEMYSSQGKRHNYNVPQFFDPSIFYERESFDDLVRGVTMQPAQDFDGHVSEKITKGMFGKPENGFDVIALDIQRGRDHGIPGYNEWREYCGLPRLRNFDDLSKAIDPNVAQNLRRIYGNVDDVDLYPAGISELPLPDALLGPTFACIIAEQFRRLKLGDRFWYENGGMESSFDRDQLEEIRKITLSRLLCSNTYIDVIQPSAFEKPTKKNSLVECKGTDIPRMSFEPWKNEPVWT